MEIYIDMFGKALTYPNWKLGMCSHRYFVSFLQVTQK